MQSISSQLPDKLYRAEQVREMDRVVIENCKISGLTLMEQAGSATYLVLRSTWPDAKKITVLCGSGNNGGDGYVLARLAHEAGCIVRLLHIDTLERLQGDARQAADALIATGLKPETFTREKLADADVLVDALLGTGLDREVVGKLKTVIDAVNALDTPVLSIDIPSGLNADTGRVMGVAVKANLTINFIGLKQGLFTGVGREYAGKIMFDDLGVPKKIYKNVTPASRRIDLGRLNSLLSARARSAHKGHYGHVLIVGGDSGYAGAARMAGEAAARVGAGLVSLATRAEHAAVISMARPEIMAHGVESTGQLLPLLERANIVAIGPGLGQSHWALSLLAKILESELPIVVDADALNLLAQEPAQNKRWILTPHPGEAARLLACDTAMIQTDRFTAARKLQQRYGGVIVLKGSGTVIVDQDGDVAVCSAGNPGMASGGMGDVLTGVIAGFVAQGYGLGDAARLGVCLHAAAGDEAAREGERGLLASDLMPLLRRLVNPPTL